MSSAAIKRLRTNLAATGLRYLPKAAQRRRRDVIFRAAADGTTDERLLDAASKQTKAEERWKRGGNHNQSSRRRKAPSRGPDAPARRHNYGSGKTDAQSYYQHKQAMKSAERQEQHQAGFPEALRHPTTIGLSILAVDAVLKDEKNRARLRLRTACDSLSDGACVQGASQVEMQTARYLAKMFPKEEWPQGFDPISEPDRLWGFLHIHVVICDPEMTKNQLRRHLKQAYPGKNRVCIRRVKPVVKLSDGTETAGAQGYLEYAWRNEPRADMDTPAKTAEAILEFIRMNTTWDARSRGFSYGKSLEKSGTVLDKERVKFIVAQDRAQWIKDHGHQLDYAVWFLHAWMSGLIDLQRSSKEWVEAFRKGLSPVSAMISVLSNWATTTDFKDIDFSEFFAAPLRE